MNAGIGKITSWNDDKGFGFITPKAGGKSVFMHVNDFSKKHNRPTQGLSVTYKLSRDSKGRRCAIHVCPEKGYGKVSKTDKQKILSIFISCTFISIVIWMVLQHKLPVTVLGWYVVVSIFTVGLYAKDKSAAQAGNWRTSESTLHLFSFAGGWPGAAIAQGFLRHKSKKLSFRIVYWFTVAVNCGLLWWLITPGGTDQLGIILKNLSKWIPG